MEKRAVILKTDGTAHEVLPADGKKFSLAELQKAVGGYIELVNLVCGCKMFVNEEGKVHSLPPNTRASWQFWNSHPACFEAGDYICGDAIICREECTE